MKVAIVNTLKDGRPQYRLGDAVLMRHTGFGRKAFAFIADNAHLFQRSVGVEYARSIDRDNPAPQWEVLEEVVRRRCSELDLELPRDDELVVHLRMGDVKGFKLRAEMLVEYIEKSISRLESPIRQVTVVTALHYGRSVLENELTESKLQDAISGELGKIEKVLGLFVESGLQARLHSHDDIDRDFCFLANARTLVLGNGHFSACAALVSRARCFIPPWARSGTEVDIDALLAARPRL
ncbi:MAG TPA: hypothetical protein EYQ27_05270 [Gemmatimonadetes bacterium]|nr:hypothetical protein [Gemmatimonadota bacterium]